MGVASAICGSGESTHGRRQHKFFTRKPVPAQNRQLRSSQDRYNVIEDPNKGSLLLEWEIREVRGFFRFLSRARFPENDFPKSLPTLSIQLVHVTARPEGESEDCVDPQTILPTYGDERDASRTHTDAHDGRYTKSKRTLHYNAERKDSAAETERDTLLESGADVRRTKKTGTRGPLTPSLCKSGYTKEATCL
eukprot:2660891-Prymnesium_polylepis.1